MAGRICSMVFLLPGLALETRQLMAWPFGLRLGLLCSPSNSPRSSRCTGAHSASSTESRRRRCLRALSTAPNLLTLVEPSLCYVGGFTKPSSMLVIRLYLLGPTAGRAHGVSRQRSDTPEGSGSSRDLAFQFATDGRVSAAWCFSARARCTTLMPYDGMLPARVGRAPLVGHFLPDGQAEAGW